MTYEEEYKKLLENRKKEIAQAEKEFYKKPLQGIDDSLMFEKIEIGQKYTHLIAQLKKKYKLPEK